MPADLESVETKYVTNRTAIQSCRLLKEERGQGNLTAVKTTNDKEGEANRRYLIS